MDFKPEFEEVRNDLISSSNFNSQIFSQLQEDTTYEVALKILARFHITLSESIENIQKGQETDNAELVWKACHKVAGTAELIGFVSLGQTSRELSKNIKASNDLSMVANEVTKYLDEALLTQKTIEKSFPKLKSFL